MPKSTKTDAASFKNLRGLCSSGNRTCCPRISQIRAPCPFMARSSFDIAGFRVTEYVVDVNTMAVIAPIRATELVTLEGISDQSLFAFNVRGPLGKTQVNRDIVKSIRDKTLHKLFPLFHNGITVIASDVAVEPERLTVRGYHVVNGCQSLTALFNTKSSLTDDLRVLVKFIKMDPESAVAQNITEYSNNQNPTKA